MVAEVFRGDRDPVIHFYEDFLSVYDNTIRTARGVFYTPEEVVAYIVRSVHESIVNDLGIELGLADSISWADYSEKRRVEIPAGVRPEESVVQILDPATGTGTFLKAVIELVHDTMMRRWIGPAWANNRQAAIDATKDRWEHYVRTGLLPRLNGFELLMAPYVVCHLRLGLALEETGFRFDEGDRLRVFLTNALEPHVSGQLEMLGEHVAEEARQAESTKTSIAVTTVVGNPPYSAISQNNGDWIVGLLKGRRPSGGSTNDYYEIDGEPLGEKKVWLQDDYVKFIRLAQWRVSEAGLGVVGMVTNNGFLSNPTFRGMRQQLMETFNLVSVTDLHGSTKNRRRLPAGCADENVFDIEQGVAVSVMVRAPSADSMSIAHKDLWGTRAEKFALLKSSSTRVDHTALQPKSPYYFWFPWEGAGQGGESTTLKITDLMPVSTTGAITARDAVVVGFGEDELIERIGQFRDETRSDDVVRKQFFAKRKAGKYLPGDTRGWKLSDARKRVQSDRQWDSRCKVYQYRPFDVRSVYYVPWMVDWPRDDVFAHLLPAGENLCLMVCRQIVSSEWRHVLVATRSSTTAAYPTRAVSAATPFRCTSSHQGPVSSSFRAMTRGAQPTLPSRPLRHLKSCSGPVANGLRRIQV